MSFFIKKNNKTELLLRQNHSVGGMIEAPNGIMETVHQGSC